MSCDGCVALPRGFMGLVVVGRLFLAVPRGCLHFVIVVFPDHSHLLFLSAICDCGIS